MELLIEYYQYFKVKFIKEKKTGVLSISCCEQ